MTLKIDRNINKHKLFYVVLDKVDILIKNDMSSVHKLADIASLSKSNLKFILISRELATELFIQPKLIDRSFNPTPIVLQDYNEYQLASILRPEFELGSNEDYTAFVTIIYSLLHKYTTKIYHYRFVILNLYKNYLDTAYQLQNADDKLKILHKVIERELEDIDNTLYKRVPLFKDFQDGLSKEAKLLIIAGYICSHNHPKYDKTTLKGIRKTHKKRITKNVENTTLKPPEKFQLMRLQSVYTILYHLSYAQRATEVMQIPMETPSFCSLVNILVQKRFFKREGKNEALGNDRFRCLADLEWVKELAESMDIKLDELVIGLNTN